MTSRRVGCARCGHFTNAPPDARTIRCFSCSATIRLQPISNEAPRSATGHSRPNRRPLPHVVNGPNTHPQPVYRQASLAGRPVHRQPTLAGQPVHRLPSIAGQLVHRLASLVDQPNHGSPPSQGSADLLPQIFNLQVSLNGRPNHRPPPPPSEDTDEPPPRRIHPQQYSQDGRGRSQGNRCPPPPPSEDSDEPPPRRIHPQQYSQDGNGRSQGNRCPPPPPSEEGDDPPPRRIHPQQYSQDRKGRPQGNRWPPTQVVEAPPRQLASPPSAFGRKRAVVCGINYRGKSYSLEGSINDAKSIRSFLIQFLGFPVESVLMLTEEERSPDRLPTKANMRKAMRWLVHGTKAGDSLFFHYSGHGSRQKDYNGDEQDSQDEALCPLDHETEGKIIDDEINQTLVWPLPRAATLHAVIDACYSATVLDLPFVCKMNSEGKYFWENHTTHAYKGTSGGTAICLSACEDHQTSGDTSAFDGRNAGAMTYGFIKAVKSEPGLTYGRLLSLMRLTIREAKASTGVEDAFSEPDLSEEPQISSSEQFDLHSRKFSA